MIGRQSELNHLNALYNSNKFEYLVMYGRRRVGKTTLLQEFSKDKNVIFFPAQEKNDALNLQDFSKMVQMKFDGMFISAFAGWKESFEYIDKKAGERTLIIIDEFPFIAEENPTVKSILQHAIDHLWKKNKNIFLILCGSSVSFMEQLDANFLVDPYKPQRGYETLSGFVQRFWDNCTLYLSKHLMKLFGFKDYDSRQYSVFLTVFIIVVFLLCGFYIYKKNKKLFTVFGYVVVMVAVTFVMVQKLWDQERLIMIYFPMIAGLVLYSLNEGLKWKNSLVSKIFAAVVLCAIMRQTFVKGNFDLTDNFSVGSYSTYTDDWSNYMKASKWAGENLPEGSVVACRKSQMSWMASEGTKRVKFYGIYKLYCADADTMQHYLLDSVKATHVIMANLRLNPYELNGKTITTIRYSLRNLTNKYPYSLKLVKQFGDKEPAYLFEFTDYKKVDVDNLLCSVIVNPENVNAWTQAGILYLNAGENDKAISCMDEAHKFNPKEYQFPYYQAFAYNNKGDKQTALKKIDESLKIKATDGEVFYNKAVLLYETSMYREALQALEESKKLNYNNQNVSILENELKKLLK